ncbi:hypothetical protein [Streptomyces iranensis]|uniref:hypothetical protein n=1 Tax=Streptomyces iranensis TaxID=576784 RepID=UPI0039B73C31
MDDHGATGRTSRGERLRPGGKRPDVEFVGPPLATNVSKHHAIAAALKERPGEWAVVQRSVSAAGAGSTAQAIRTAKLAAYAPAGSFEAVSRTVKGENGDGEHRIYARFVGGAK